ncbi:hypothetical protein Q604_UNBc4C00197G0001, partial [human gut metagenome]
VEEDKLLYTSYLSLTTVKRQFNRW